jgi:hypothetical protein
VAEFGTRPIPFDDKRELNLRLLVGGKPFLALTAAATTADDVPLFRLARFNDGGTVRATERALHRAAS